MVPGISTPYDELPIEVRRENWGWFGEPWWSWICYGEDGQLLTDMHKPFPAGETCLHCGEPFDEAAGDSGQAMPCVRASGQTEVRHAHRECSLRSVVGPIAHLERRCHCHGGSNETPGLSLRQDALAVQDWVRVHGAAAAVQDGEGRTGPSGGEPGAARGTL